MGSVWLAVKMDTFESIVTSVRKEYTFIPVLGINICKTYFRLYLFKRTKKATLVKVILRLFATL